MRFKVVVENDLRKEEFEEIDDENNEEINVKQESETTEAVQEKEGIGVIKEGRLINCLLLC